MRIADLLNPATPTDNNTPELPFHRVFFDMIENEATITEIFEYICEHFNEFDALSRKVDFSERKIANLTKFLRERETKNFRLTNNPLLADNPHNSGILDGLVNLALIEDAHQLSETYQAEITNHKLFEAMINALEYQGFYAEPCFFYHSNQQMESLIKILPFYRPTQIALRPYIFTIEQIRHYDDRDGFDVVDLSPEQRLNYINYLRKIVITPSNIEAVDCRDNKIDDSALLTMISGNSLNRRLNAINLAQNQLSFRSKSLTESFFNQEFAISMLDLSVNNIDGSGLVNILNAIEFRELPKVLDLSSNSEIKPYNFRLSQTNFFQNNKHLWGLYLGGNSLGEENLRQIFKGMALNHSIKSLGLDNIDETNFNEAVDDFAKMLKCNTSLEFLIIDSNNITEKNFDKIITALSQNFNIISMKISDENKAHLDKDNLFSENQSAMITEITKRNNFLKDFFEGFDPELYQKIVRDIFLEDIKIFELTFEELVRENPKLLKELSNDFFEKLNSEIEDLEIHQRYKISPEKMIIINKVKEKLKEEKCLDDYQFSDKPSPDPSAISFSEPPTKKPKTL